MVQINFALREVSCKIVYYGPGMGGKTTNLQVVHDRAPADHKGKLTSIATEGDRTLFFDFLPLDLGTVGGMKTKLQLYTVPGQVYYNATRKLVLEGADGIIFVADSQQDKMTENIESWQNLQDNLREYGLDINEIPVVVQYNKQDLPDLSPVAELEAKVNTVNALSFEASATNGEGVFPTLKAISSIVLERLNKKQTRAAGVRPKPKPKVEQPVARVAAGAPQRTGAATVSRPPTRETKSRQTPPPVPSPRPVRVPEPRPQPVTAHAKTPGQPARKISVAGAIPQKKSKKPYIIAVVIGGLVLIGVLVALLILL